MTQALAAVLAIAAAGLLCTSYRIATRRGHSERTLFACHVPAAACAAGVLVLLY